MRVKKKRIFKYYPEDFGSLQVEVKHMDLSFDVYSDHTVVDSEIHLKALEDLKKVQLNAKNLEILEVSSPDGKTAYKYLKKDGLVMVGFSKKILKGSNFRIKTKTICRPTKNVLEGLYYDETPKACPCQQITQCQQWGFQRIVPCIDDMTAKCTYKTRIVADKRYTNLISNGDVSEKRHEFNKKRDVIKYDNVITPMATYLFFLGVGTYATFKKEFEYPDGTKFMLELLVPPASKKDVAMKALDVLYDAIMWIYLFTGADKFKNWKKSFEIKKLVEQRNILKENGKGGAAEKIRKKLVKTLQGMTFGYKYTGTVYREIGMQNSDFGGMENVGNTTITTNRIMPFPEMTDSSFEYMVRVKVHEFYHNLNGSEVTGRSPFEIWLNEAVTVFIEQEYHEFLFGEEYCRLDSALDFLAPGTGTFASDDNVASMPIEPDGFNDTNELITGVTYVKAPEFVRMIETLMGVETFVKGLDLYHRRYKHGNASRAQWIESMEEASGMNFQRMAQVWLKQSSYPKVYVKSKYFPHRKIFVLSLEQKGFKQGMHWEFPFDVALYDKKGRSLADRIYRVNKVKEEIIFKNVAKPAFVSMNRNFSFFGKVFYEFSSEELYLQAKIDIDIVNRYMAFYHLAEREMLKLLNDKNAKVDKDFVDLYFRFLSDSKLMENVGPAILTIFETVEEPRFAHSYDHLYEARKKIKKAIAEKYGRKILRLYGEYHKKTFKGKYIDVQVKSIKARQVKNSCLGLLAEWDNEEVWNLIKKQFVEAQCATDKISAFTLYINSKAPDKMKVLKTYMKQSQKSLVSWESFLAAVARNNSDDCVKVMREVEKSPSFRIEQTNDQRALYIVFANNRKKSLLTKDGREFLKYSIENLVKINEYTCSYLIKVFGNIDQIEEKYQADLVKILMDVKKGLSKEKTPSVYNTIERILDGSPKGMKRYKEIYG